MFIFIYENLFNELRKFTQSTEQIKIFCTIKGEAAREASGLMDLQGTGQTRRILFLDPAVTPTTSAQKKAFVRLKNHFSDVVEISVSKGQSLKEAIGKRVAIAPGNVRYVYVGTQPLDDFRCAIYPSDWGHFCKKT